MAGSPFVYVESIGSTGEDLMVSDEARKDYNPFMVNRALAQNIDTIMFAQEMNKLPGLDRELQYKFLLKAVSKKKRFNKWAKKAEVEPDLEVIMEVYQVSLEKATEIAALVTAEQMEVLKSRLDHGGIKGRGGKPKK